MGRTDTFASTAFRLTARYNTWGIEKNISTWAASQDNWVELPETSAVFKAPQLIVRGRQVRDPRSPREQQVGASHFWRPNPESSM